MSRYSRLLQATLPFTMLALGISPSAHAQTVDPQAPSATDAQNEAGVRQFELDVPRAAATPIPGGRRGRARRASARGSIARRC